VSAVDKLLALTGNGPEVPDPDTELLRAAQQQARELEALVCLAWDDDDDGKGGGGGDHSGHSTYKALIAKKVDPKRAATMCARSDKNVKASQLARSLVLMLSGEPGRDLVLTLTAGEHARRAVPLPPATGDEEAAALAAQLPGVMISAAGLEEVAELAAKAMGDGGIIMNHGPFTGEHAHGHFQSNVHTHPHKHFGDNRHDGGPQHRPGSQPGGRAGW
jgi:hypothetical protein